MSERTPQDVLRELRGAIKRVGTEVKSHHGYGEKAYSVDAIDRAEVLALIDKAIAEAPDSPQGWDSGTMRALLSDGTTEAPDSISGLGSAQSEATGPTASEALPDRFPTEPAFHFRGSMRKPLYHGPWCVHGRGENEPFIHDDACHDSRGEVPAPDTLSEKPGLDVERLAAAINEACVLHGPAGSTFDSLTQCAPGIAAAYDRAGGAAQTASARNRDGSSGFQPPAPLASTDSEGR